MTLVRIIAPALLALLWACASTPAAVGDEDPSAGQASAAAALGVPLGEPCGPGLGRCGEDGFCAFPSDDACGELGSQGTCTERPRGCKRDCPRVCGCDGRTYCNTCSARAQGAAVRHHGACVEEGVSGACDELPACPHGEACDEEGDLEPGICTP